MIQRWRDLTPERRNRWLTDALSSDAFWASAPSWRTTAASVVSNGEMIVWTEVDLFSMERVAGALAGAVNGCVTLADLAADLEAVTELPADSARSVVAATTLELCSLGAYDSVELPDQPPASSSSELDDHAAQQTLGQLVTESSERIEIDPDSGEAIRVVSGFGPQGQRVTTEYLPDGRRRITTSTEFAVASNEPDTTAAGVLTGERSVAELVPADSCLGSKLRNHPEVQLISFRCPDHQIRSVRCHSSEVANLLRERARDCVVPGDERGPIEAFVVTPLEGVGPLRVYDGRGERRGRPRSFSEVASIVDQILGECATNEPQPVDGAAADVTVRLELALTSNPAGQAVLVPMHDLLERRTHKRLKQAGWTLTWSHAVLHPDGMVAAPSAFGTPAIRSSNPDILTASSRPESFPQRVQILLGRSASQLDLRQSLLERAISLATSAHWRPMDTLLVTPPAITHETPS